MPAFYSFYTISAHCRMSVCAWESTLLLFTSALLSELLNLGRSSPHFFVAKVPILFLLETKIMIIHDANISLINFKLNWKLFTCQTFSVVLYKTQDLLCQMKLSHLWAKGRQVWHHVLWPRWRRVCAILSQLLFSSKFFLRHYFSIWQTEFDENRCIGFPGSQMCNWNAVVFLFCNIKGKKLTIS